MMLDSKSRKKYLTISPVDLIWGLAVNSVGRQNVAENEVYPPQGHPTRYLFNTSKGRVLNEYQLLYITKGKGTFASRYGGTVSVKEGTMFLLSLANGIHISRTLILDGTSIGSDLMER